MKKHIPNFITCLNLLTGAIGIVAVTNTHYWPWGILFVCLSSIFDFLDGLAARSLKVQSEIGKQLDSLADLVSFGVLPSMCWFFLWTQIDSTGIYAYLALLIIPFSALRLAKFNVATDQDNEFKGLPTPANAFMLVSIASFHTMFPLTKGILIIITLISCALLISNLRMIAFKFKNLSIRDNAIRYLLLSLVVAGLFIFQWSFVPFVVPAYIVTSLIGNFFSRPVLT